MSYGIAVETAGSLQGGCRLARRVGPPGRERSSALSTPTTRVRTQLLPPALTFRNSLLPQYPTKRFRFLFRGCNGSQRTCELSPPTLGASAACFRTYLGSCRRRFHAITGRPRGSWTRWPAAA